MNNQNSIFTCPVFDITWRDGQAYALMWTTKFHSGHVNPKSYLPSLATKVYGFVCRTSFGPNLTFLLTIFYPWYEHIAMFSNSEYYYDVRYHCDILYELYVSESRTDLQVHITHTGYHTMVLPELHFCQTIIQSDITLD